MDKTKKIMLVVFATMLVINLQFNTPLTKGMDDGFSLSQLVENVFVQESFASEETTYDWVIYENDGTYETLICCYPGATECEW